MVQIDFVSSGDLMDRLVSVVHIGLPPFTVVLCFLFSACYFSFSLKLTTDYLSLSFSVSYNSL